MLAVLALVALCAATGVDASDRIGVYAVVDKVIFEPPSGPPQRVQLWGAFAIAKRGDAKAYEPVQRGYLYFSIGESRDLAEREWNDLKTLANGKTIVGFSKRFGQSVRLRAQTEVPQLPDPYVVDVGVRTMRADTSYAPVQQLVGYTRR
jgi:hypothetical protein